MTAVPDLPRRLWSIRNAAVEHAVSGAPLTSSLSKLLEWLEGEGRDALVDGWEKAGEPVALRLEELAQDFADVELGGWVDIEPNHEVTDALRLSYVRWRIEVALEDDCDTLSPTVHPYRLERVDGSAAILGCTVVMHGQAGPKITCQGVFSAIEQYYRHLKESGIWLPADLAALDDATILKMWRHTKATVKSRRAM
jgi:hypothetical protein